MLPKAQPKAKIHLALLFTFFLILSLNVAHAENHEEEQPAPQAETQDRTVPGIVIQRGPGTVMTEQTSVGLQAYLSNVDTVAYDPEITRLTLQMQGYTGTVLPTSTGVPRLDGTGSIQIGTGGLPAIWQGSIVSGNTIGDTTTLNFNEITIDRRMHGSILVTANTRDEATGTITLTPQVTHISTDGTIRYTPLQGVPPIEIKPSRPFETGIIDGKPYSLASGTATMPGGQLKDATFCTGDAQACAAKFAQMGLTIDASYRTADGRTVYIAYAKEGSFDLPGQGSRPTTPQSASNAANQVSSISTYFSPSSAVSFNLSEIIMLLQDDLILEDVNAKLTDLANAATDYEGTSLFVRSSGSADFTTASSFVSVFGGNDLYFTNGLLFIGSAASFSKDGATLSNTKRLVVGNEQFYVGSADSLAIGCTRIGSIENVIFRVKNDRLEIFPRSQDSFSVTDCLSNVIFFEPKGGNITLMRTSPLTYFINDGTMIVASANYTERIDANNSAIVEFDAFGIACVTISPEGAYWYNDKNDLRKDFALTIPKAAGNFKICFRRSITQVARAHDGMVSFLQNYIYLEKPVQYLRYPFKLGEVSSLLMRPMHQLTDTLNVTIQLESDFVGIHSIEIHGKGNASEKSLTHPSNYYVIREKRMDNSTHRLMHIMFELEPFRIDDPILKSYRTQFMYPLIYNEMDSFVQREGPNSIKMFSPNHREIPFIVEKNLEYS